MLGNDTMSKMKSFMSYITKSVYSKWEIIFDIFNSIAKIKGIY